MVRLVYWGGPYVPFWVFVVICAELDPIVVAEGLRLREAGVPDHTQDDILWHSSKTMTARYSIAQIVEVLEALEKIKDETNRWNISGA